MHTTDTPTSGAESVSLVTERFKALFSSMARDNIGELSAVYNESVQFVDPFTRVNGRRALSAYLQNSYANVVSCHFEFGETIEGTGSALCALGDASAP
ncbi:nuclear transport factor 2 family protein [Marinobacter sp. X15-166B]|uniref:nuclear transport factor 2 family protein n=1 Tax=Marinobacter sp. X15-166B TaxID=1897620 RepID=UPI001D17099C|nr:nuclear transport factor 2 family protein [Marinobacter sp. X15-166B]